MARWGFPGPNPPLIHFKCKNSTILFPEANDSWLPTCWLAGHEWSSSPQAKGSEILPPGYAVSSDSMFHGSVVSTPRDQAAKILLTMRHISQGKSSKTKALLQEPWLPVIPSTFQNLRLAAGSISPSANVSIWTIELCAVWLWHLYILKLLYITLVRACAEKRNRSLMTSCGTNTSAEWLKKTNIVSISGCSRSLAWA